MGQFSISLIMSISKQLNRALNKNNSLIDAPMIHRFSLFLAMIDNFSCFLSHSDWEIAKFLSDKIINKFGVF